MSVAKYENILGHIQKINNILSNETFKDKGDDELKIEIEKRNKEIQELKSRKELCLKEGETFISVIFKEMSIPITFSVFCKNSDKFFVAIKKLKKKHDINEDAYEFRCNNNLINIKKNFIENRLKNGDKIELIKKENYFDID